MNFDLTLLIFVSLLTVGFFGSFLYILYAERRQIGRTGWIFATICLVGLVGTLITLLGRGHP